MKTFLSVVFVAVALVCAEPAFAGHKGSKGYCGSRGYSGRYYGGGWGRGYCAPYNRGYYGGGFYAPFVAPAISLGFYSGGYYGGGYGGYYGGGPYYSGGGYYGADYAPRVYTGRMIAPAPGRSVAVNVQIALQRRGYYRGSIDGVIGPQSRSAIAAFQRAQGLAVTGTIDQRMVRALGAG